MYINLGKGKRIYWHLYIYKCPTNNIEHLQINMYKPT